VKVQLLKQITYEEEKNGTWKTNKTND
jgi:hypothetical protein